MKVSLNKFTEHIKENSIFQYQHLGIDEIENIHGIVEFDDKRAFPVYNTEDNKWMPHHETNEKWGENEVEFNLHYDGKINFAILGDEEDYCSLYVYTPLELEQLIEYVKYRSENKINNTSTNLKKFKLENIIDTIYLTVKIEDKIQLCDINTIKKKITTNDFESMMKCVFEIDYQFIIENGSWDSYCKQKKIPLIDNYFGEISVLYNNKFISITDPYINTEIPHLAIKLNSEFSSQYFFDLVYYSNESKIILNYLKDNYLNNIKKKTFINAPKDLCSQILYSASFRLEHNTYLNTVNNHKNLNVDSMVDIKATCINRRENIQEYILNKKQLSFLDSLKHPLPFILDKTYRSYLRATNDFDRQSFGGRLFNFILRSIVIYPLQEMKLLNYHKKVEDIQLILDEINSGKPISDGKWVVWFNELSKVIGKNSDFKLAYFGDLVNEFQKLYIDIKQNIPKRNDWAHYREHSAEYQKYLDLLLPKLINSLRYSLKNIDIIYIEKQEYTSLTDLQITAKRIMGFEIDIETIEFNTTLPGNQFINNKLYAYNSKCQYTIPLEPFIDIKFENVKTVKMGIFDSISNGEIEYAY